MSEYRNEKYNPGNMASILEYGGMLKGATLREMCDFDPETELDLNNKGHYGNVLQEYYFGIKPNSSPEPDFVEVGIELKVTPVKRLKNKELRAKERLVFDMIDFNSVVNETWETSSILKKCSQIFLVTYLYEDGKSQLDFQIQDAKIWEFPPDQDLSTIRHDWEKIVEKIRAGKAHELSGSDTDYLEACTKSSNSLVRRKQPFSMFEAKPRAFALKASYMNSVYERSGLIQRIPRGNNEGGLSLEELVRKRFQTYFGKKEEALLKEFHIAESKQRWALVTKSILGVSKESKIAEFELADIGIKTVRLRKNGRPKEDISFSAFDFYELASTPWEESYLFEDLSKRFLFVVFELDDGGAWVLADICFWGMPASDLEGCAKLCYEQTVEAIRKGSVEDFPRSTTNKCCHVRPHGRNKSDVLPLPNGRLETKRSFWLNAKYLKDQIYEARTKR